MVNNYIFKLLFYFVLWLKSYQQLIDDEFIKRHDRYIDYCISRYHPKDRKDCKQDIYLILCRSKFKDVNVKGYIAKIIRTYFADKHKYNSRLKRQEEKITPDPVTNPCISHLIYQKTITDLSGLKNNEALKLFAEGYHYKEIANILKVSVNCIKARIHRLRTKLNGKR